MTKQNIKVEDFEDKKAVNGQRYTRFKTNSGWMSCFDSKEAEKLKKFEGKTASVEITTSGKFSNITKVLGEADDQDEDEEQVQVVKIERDRTEAVDRAKALELTIVLQKEKLDVDMLEWVYNYIRTGETKQ